LAEAQEAAINPTAGTGNLGQGPVFGSSEGVQRTLTEIRDEIKKLVQLGGIAGSPASMSAAMTAHDASHKHEPPTITPEAAKELGQGLGSPLKNLAVTSGFGMRTDPFTGKQAGHGGVDLAGKIGDAIMAPDSGIARVDIDPDEFRQIVESRG
jgi:murein DD-endopeptidase MepM/ murein hydrolase activator NlpD